MQQVENVNERMKLVLVWVMGTGCRYAEWLLFSSLCRRSKFLPRLLFCLDFRNLWIPPNAAVRPFFCCWWRFFVGKIRFLLLFSNEYCFIWIFLIIGHSWFNLKGISIYNTHSFIEHNRYFIAWVWNIDFYRIPICAMDSYHQHTAHCATLVRLNVEPTR